MANATAKNATAAASASMLGRSRRTVRQA